MSTATPRERLYAEARHTARQRFWGDRDRDAYACDGCGTTDDRLEVHHRDGNALNNHPLNLVAVCRRCHRAVHRAEATADNLDEWRERGEELLAGGGVA